MMTTTIANGDVTEIGQKMNLLQYFNNNNLKNRKLLDDDRCTTCHSDDCKDPTPCFCNFTSKDRKLWGFSRFHDECKAGRGSALTGTILDQKEYITDSCTQMMLGLHQFYDPDKVKVKIRVVSGSHSGIVATEAMRDPTQWVILDKNMKKEAKCCEEQLDCNVVLMGNSGPKVLRLNMNESFDKVVGRFS